MPGQRRRKRGQQNEARRTSARFAPDAGRSEAGRSDVVRSEAGQSEAGRSDMVRSEAGRSDVVRSEAGRWEVLFETQDESEWHTHLRRLRASDAQIDWTAARLDRLCGRDTHPTTFRLSVFVRGRGPS
ncbi:hypothetical protein [Streptomyces sp. VNUA24]|uniref:hypothetical protein n=1 Tax=Streptomyces sp. VNUA24 TaxID=3031131 RepID=UPI0023B88326|nr:hypothetical protein [Streptomyces sp. VNUA24]WEH17097.1 hypothetical protein PYR72_26730 [Streptomyces sp. VNUA24]